MKRLQSLFAMPPGFEESAFIEEYERPIQIDQRGPRLVLLLDKYFPCFREELKPLKCVPLLARRHRRKRQALCALIRHTQLAKALASLLRQVSRFRAEVEFQIKLRQIQVAQGVVISVAD